MNTWVPFQYSKLNSRWEALPGWASLFYKPKKQQKMKLLTSPHSPGADTHGADLQICDTSKDLPTSTGADLQIRASNLYFPTLLIALLLLWPLAQRFIAYQDPSAGAMDPNIWLLLLFSLICFLLLLGLCLWLLQLLLRSAGLSNLFQILSQLKNQSPWQQIQCYLASFIALLLAAVGVLSAII